MFRATMCPSSGEITISMRTWYLSLCIRDCLVCRFQPADQTFIHRVTYTKYRIDTVISPDDGHIVARNM